MRYLGGKSRIAKGIGAHLTSHDDTLYVEPFVGGGAVLTRVARAFDRIIAADVMPDLIDMYQAIQLGWLPPNEITESEYLELRDSSPSALRTFAGFGVSFGGKWWGGYARDRVGHNYAQGSRNSLLRSVKAGMFDPHVEFRACSAFDLALPQDLGGAVIYCDPPYSGVTAYRGVGEFDSGRAWALFQDWSRRGAHVYVSEYDGPTELVVDEFTPQSFLKRASSDRVTERLFYLPPVGVDGIGVGKEWDES